MSVLLEVARLAAVANIVLLMLLGYVWGRSYLRVGAAHTLGLLIFAGFLVIQNSLWLYLYTQHYQFMRWFEVGDATYQVGMTLLCGLQTVALLALIRITWK